MRLHTDKRIATLAAAVTGVVLGLGAATSQVDADTLTLQMRDGKAGSAGAKDTSIWARADGDADFGVYPKLRIRTPSGSNPRCNALVAFPSLIGDSAEQVPANATITSAILELHARTESVQGNPDVWAAQLYKDWFEGTGGTLYNGDHNKTGTTWNYAQAYGDMIDQVPWTNSNAATDQGGGLDPADSDQANPVPGVVSTENVLAETWDITNIVQNWANGQPNYGVIMFVQPNSGGLNILLQPQETLDLNDQPVPFAPKLTIEYSIGAVGASSWNIDDDGNWTTAGNWTGSVPNAVGAEAQFGGKITAAHTVTLDSPQTVGAISFDNANSYTIAGTSTLTIDVSTGSGSIKVLNGSHSIAAPVVLADDTSVDVAAGQTLSVQHLRGAGVTVNSGTVKMIAGASANSADGASKLTAVAVGAGAAVDLTNNSLVIDYTGTSVQDDVRQALADGRIISSSADANKKLGYGEASATGFANGTFAGQSVDGDAVLIKFTYGGDSNLDGKVDVGDLGNLASNWQQSAPWTGGDFDYNGTVNVGDLGILATNWQQGVTTPTLGPSFADALAALGLPNVSVPEPASFGLIGLGLSWMLRRHRQRI